MTQKICSRCKVPKDLIYFHKNKNRPFGVHEYCKECRKQENDTAKVRSSKNYRLNRETLLLSMATYYQKNKEKKKEYAKQHYINNQWKYIANASKRKQVVQRATPTWLSNDDLFLIEEAFHLAQLRSNLLGFRWEVDHYYPLQGKTVCGLHTIDNLQVIPAHVNNKKRNKHPDQFYATGKK